MSKESCLQSEMDKKSIDKYKQGDEQGFAEFFDRHVNGLYNFVYKYVKDHQIAEDITQEAFLNFLKKVRSIKFKYAPSSFLYKVALNLCYDLFKSSYHKTTSLVEDDKLAYFNKNKNNNDSFIKIRKNEIQDIIDFCLNELSQKEKTVYLLRNETEFTFDEISKTTGIPVRTAKRYLENTLEKIGFHLKKSGFKREDFV